MAQTASASLVTTNAELSRHLDFSSFSGVLAFWTLECKNSNPKSTGPSRPLRKEIWA
jgi:hypothetical protein